MIRRHVFLVGCARSGTTLLQRMLDAHSAIAITPETFFMRHFWRRQYQYYPLESDSNYKRLIEDIVSTAAFKEMGISASRFHAAAWQSPRDYAVLFRLILDLFAELKDVSVVGEKTPNHVLFMPQLKRFFPNARFVHIVRDPRAVVNSWRGIPWSSGSIVKDALVWRRDVATARRDASKLGDDFKTIHYEDLVTAPESVLRKICVFIGVPFDPAMLTYFQQPTSVINIEREPWKRNVMHPINPAASERWRKDLSSEMVREIEAAVWFEMQRWGYQPETKPDLFKIIWCTAGRSIRLTYQRIRYHLRRLTRSLQGHVMALGLAR